MMKILFVKHDGVLKSNRRYLEILSERTDWEIHLISPEYWYEPSFRKKFYFESSDDSIIKHPVKSFFARHPIFFKYNSKQLTNEIKEINPEVVFISNDPYAISAYQAIKGLRDKKIIIYGIQNIKKYIPFPFSSIYRHNLKYCDYFLGCNTATLKINQDWGFKGPVDYLPIGIDREHFKKKTNYSLPDIPRIGFVGRVEEIKGIKYLIRALNILEFKVKLTVIGEGSQLNWIKENVNKNKIELIIKSFVSHNKMPEEYLNLDLLIVPSITIWRWKEQFGRVLVEAMASGVPVIGSDSGAIPDVLGDAGIIVKERNAEDINRAIKLIVNDEDLRIKLIKKGFMRVEKYFFWESVADKVINVIEKTMKP
ncbi:MAG: glycosyltransferase family 4 protein [bacterium]|nr:glycosyltransferase family 4 protein [bacterium]